MDGDLLFFGPDLLDRTKYDTVLSITQNVTGGVFGESLMLRWTAFTAHPSQTPGAASAPRAPRMQWAQLAGARRVPVHVASQAGIVQCDAR